MIEKSGTGLRLAPLFYIRKFCKETPNGLRYLRWGGDGEAVQLEKAKACETA